MVTRAGYSSILAPLAGLLAASLSLLVVGSGANGLVCGPSWSTLASAEHLKKPSAIAAIASNDIWVVGSTKDSAHAIRTGAQHWDGNSWSQIPLPDVGTGENMLNGVDASEQQCLGCRLLCAKRALQHAHRALERYPVAGGEESKRRHH
jgi:hypothetical protein